MCAGEEATRLTFGFNSGMTVDTLRSAWVWWVITRKDQISKCLTEKMLTYALGRKLGFRDRPQIHAITEALGARGDGLRDLVELVVASDAFGEREQKTASQ